MRLFGDASSLPQGHHHVIEYILEGEQESRRDSTLRDLGSNTCSRPTAVSLV